MSGVARGINEDVDEFSSLAIGKMYVGHARLFTVIISFSYEILYLLTCNHQ